MISIYLLKAFSVWNLPDEKKCVMYSFTSLYIFTGNYGCVINIRKIFSFLPVINCSLTTELLLIISAIISSNTINTFRFIPGFCSSLFSYLFYIFYITQIFDESLRILQIILSKILMFFRRY